MSALLKKEFNLNLYLYLTTACPQRADFLSLYSQLQRHIHVRADHEKDTKFCVALTRDQFIWLNESLRQEKCPALEFGEKFYDFYVVPAPGSPVAAEMEEIVRAMRERDEEDEWTSSPQLKQGDSNE